MLEILKVGLDPGFGHIKVAVIIDGDIHVLSIPSSVGVGSVDSGALNLAGVVRARRRKKPQVVACNGVEFIVGEGVEEYAPPVERTDFGRFLDGEELRALFYGATYQLLGGVSHKIALAVGLPIQIIEDKKLAASTERKMSEWLMGEHRFSVDGKEMTLEVVGLRAKVAQPVATWLDWGLDTDGQWVQGNASAKAPALVVDIGFNTVDILGVEGGRVSTRYTAGDTLGMRRASEMAQERIQRKHGVSLSLHETDDLVRGVVTGKGAEVYVEGEPVDVRPEVRQAIGTLGSELLRFVERSVGTGKKFKILLTGGGSIAMVERLLRQYPHAELVPDPALANARGLAKVAARPGFLG